VPYLPHGTLFSWVVSRFKAASLVAALNISRGSLYKPRPVWPPILPAAHGRAASGVHVSAQISTKAGDFGGGAVAGVVGIEVGVVSGVFNLESSGVDAPEWRPRHEEH
jgi:hypothetical protein